VKSYGLAEKLAAQTAQGKLESVADVNEAELQAKTGKLDDALRLYQHALQLDTAANDDSASAQDWLAYGHFLDVSGFPERLAYACIVKSETITQSLPDKTQADSMVATRKQIEKRLGSEASAIRRDPNEALQEALTLRR
jgi:tetratricopeptide (TPR) repeat protein